MGWPRFINVTPAGYDKCACGCTSQDGIITEHCLMHEVAKAVHDADMAHNGPSDAYENMAEAAITVFRRRLFGQGTQ